jgi:hypothetical protein
MTDRTYFAVDFEDAEHTFDDATLDALTTRLDFDGWDRYHEGESHIQITVEEHPCGEAETVASELLAWMREEPAARLRAFTVTESSAYGYLGSYVTFDPERDAENFHSAPYIDGACQLDEMTAAHLIADAEGSFEALVLALGQHFGPEFDASVTKATADRRERAAAAEREANAARVRECGYPEPPAERVAEKDLTRTQRDALAALRRRGNLWPAGRGRWSGGNETPWERKTLDGLVRAGHARWVIYGATTGVLPHIVPA